MKFPSKYIFISQSIVINGTLLNRLSPLSLYELNHFQVNQAFTTMASGVDPPDAVDKDNSTSACADLSALARARIDAARPLPREPPTGLFATNGSTPSFSGNPLDVSIDSIVQPAEVTVDLTTFSTVCQMSTVEVGNGTTVGNSGTITVDSEEPDTTLKPKFSSPPKETKTVSFTDKKNDDSSSPKKTSMPVPLYQCKMHNTNQDNKNLLDL